MHVCGVDPGCGRFSIQSSQTASAQSAYLYLFSGLLLWTTEAPCPKYLGSILLAGTTLVDSSGLLLVPFGTLYANALVANACGCSVPSASELPSLELHDLQSSGIVKLAPAPHDTGHSASIAPSET